MAHTAHEQRSQHTRTQLDSLPLCARSVCANGARSGGLCGVWSRYNTDLAAATAVAGGGCVRRRRA